MLKASMRPRVFPAEDARHVARRHGPSRRFNEAAGIPRGRPTAAVTAYARRQRLQ